MSRKQRHRRRRRASAPPKFTVGAAVRVRQGIMDPDYPDIPLGGWVGTITEVDPRRPVHYLIEWNRATRNAMHPVFRKRCLRDDFDIGDQWLREDDIEEDTGAPLAVRQPASIVTPPLDLEKPDDRIRAVFGLTSDDPLPNVSEDGLRTYHRHLLAHLVFPIPAQWDNLDVDALLAYTARFSVTGLLDADEGDKAEGLLCEALDDDQKVVVPLAEIRIKRSNPNWQTIEDYSYWFANAPRDSWDEPQDSRDERELVPEQMKSQWLDCLGSMVVTALVFAFYGAIAGSIGGALDGALLAWRIGAAIVGLLGLILASARDVASGAGLPRWHSACRGLLVGGLAGGLFGMILTAFPAALAGAIGLGMAARLLARRAPGAAITIGAILGATLGATVQAWWYSAEDALAGAGAWAAICATAGLVWSLTEAALRRVYRWRRTQSVG